MLRIFVVKSEGLATEYDVYDEWCVVAETAEQAYELVRKDSTYIAQAEPLILDSDIPVGPIVAYASFHPG